MGCQSAANSALASLPAPPLLFFDQCAKSDGGSSGREGWSDGSEPGWNHPAIGAPLTTAFGSALCSQSILEKTPQPPALLPVSTTCVASPSPCCDLSSAIMLTKEECPWK